jgi:ectoine hydroxylase-related dioxygenase (phytanoyl-CoA dioxygenase family)
MTSAELIQTSPVLEAVERMLTYERRVAGGSGERVFRPTVQISCTQLIEIGPREVAQELHRDDSVHHTFHPGVETSINSMYAFSDFTAENGATRVVPGSHKWDDTRTPQEHEVVQATMPRGSILIWLGSTWHGGGPNRTADQYRLGAAYTYSLGHLRQEENQYLAVPREVVRQYPKRVQDLLGYCVSPPMCGFVEGQQPSVVLQDIDASVLGAADLR